MASADGPSPDADGPDSVALSRIVEIEQRRIDSRNRQAEVMLRLIAADAADKRQYDYGVKQLESNERVAKARLSLAAYIAIGAAAAFVLFFISGLRDVVFRLGRTSGTGAAAFDLDFHGAWRRRIASRRAARVAAVD